MGRFSYKFDVLTSRKTFRDLREDSPLRKLLATVRDELGKRQEETIADEQIGEGTSSLQKHFTGYLSHKGVKPGTLEIHALVVGDTTETLEDQGDGTLSSTEGGSGTIVYSTGYFDVTFYTAPKEGAEVFADYVGFYSTQEFTSDGLNEVYDARFIQHASGDALDNWGQTLEFSRSAGESDEDYRERLLDELRDFTASLTVKAFKDRVIAIIGLNPSIIPFWELAPDWPLEWDEVSTPWTTWAPWGELVDFLLVVPSGLSDVQVNQIAQAVSDIKFAPGRSLIVTGPVSGVYSLLKEVG